MSHSDSPASWAADTVDVDFFNLKSAWVGVTEFTNLIFAFLHALYIPSSGPPDCCNSSPADVSPDVNST